MAFAFAPHRIDIGGLGFIAASSVVRDFCFGYSSRPRLVLLLQECAKCLSLALTIPGLPND